MSLYLDIHKHIPGLTAAAIAGAHAKDLEVQGKYGVKFLKYWFDEGAGKAFCLVRPRAKKRRPQSIGRLTVSSRTRSTKSRKACSHL
jgi:hypothetical protein